MVVPSRVARTLALAVILSVATVGSAVATTKNGITPVAPKAGTSVPQGKAATFRMKVAHPGAGVFVNVCKSKHKDKDGVICSKVTILQAKKHKGTWEAKQKFFDFPAFWLNNPGTYYWQAYATTCNGGDCKAEGPVVRFKVR